MTILLLPPPPQPVEQVQSDWNQNDENAPDYIKNRICSESTGNVTLLDEEMTPVSTQGTVLIFSSSETEFDFQENKTYDVTIGENYYPQMTVVNYMGYIAIVNGDPTDPEANGSFLIMKDEDKIALVEIIVPAPSILTSVHLKIEGIGTVINKIDPKFIDLPAIKNGIGKNSIIVNDIENNVASGEHSYAEGCGCQAEGDYSHAEGSGSYASGEASHSEGYANADGEGSHAEGHGSATGDYSHAEGDAYSSGDYSHAEGKSELMAKVTSSGYGSHAEGHGTIANHAYQHVFGEFNIEDDNSAESTDRGNYVEIVGNGTKRNSRSNARTLDWDGNEQLQGTLRLGSTSGTGGALIKFDSGALKVSFDDGTTWQTVTLS